MFPYRITLDMKFVAIFIRPIGFAPFNQRNDDSQRLQAQNDSLQNKLVNSYKPGFGEFINGIQIYHGKL